MEPRAKTLDELVRKHATPLSLIALALLAAVVMQAPRSVPVAASRTSLEEAVLPSSGVELPIRWGDLGAKLVASGVIDAAKLKTLYTNRGGFPPDYEVLLERGADKKIVMTNWNAGYLLNLLWALGLANSNPVLEDKAEMRNPAYGGADRFASTGGWTLGREGVMAYYGKFDLVPLTKEEQAKVDRVSRGIFRPCCGNSAHFPDCNHGMAMLGLLELLASQGASEADMYKTALAANSFWFPSTYLTIAQYFSERGVSWKDVPPQEALSAAYSSASGFMDIASKVRRAPAGAEGGGCSA